MEFASKNIFIKSSWFNEGSNTYKKLGIQSFFLYLNLFRFLLESQNSKEYTYICSISLLRKETKYTSQLVLDLLKHLVKCKVIRINLTRWDRILDTEGKIIDDKLLIITSLDNPQLSRVMVNRNGKESWEHKPDSEDDYYISLNMPLMQYYIDEKLNERYFGLYCLISKYSNGTEGKCWLSINKMADILGFGDKTVNSMIYEMNKKYLLYSRYMKTDKKVIGKSGDTVNGSKFEHFLLGNLDHKEQWLAAHKDRVDKNIRKWDTRTIIEKEIAAAT